MKKQIIAVILAMTMVFIIIPTTEVGAVGDSFADAIDITDRLDTKITGTFETGNQVIYHTFTAPVTGRYQIRTDGISKPVRFYLCNADQTQINYYDNEYLVNLTAGTSYYLNVRSVSSSVAGDFSFTVVTPHTKETKGGSFETAIDDITTDTVIKGKINVPGKVDYYIFTAPVTGKYQIRTDEISSPTRFQLYNANQSSINYYDNEYIADLTAGTTYYLTARSTFSSATGDYSFVIVEPNLQDGKGGSFETAAELPVNEVVSGFINVPGKVDYYIFTAEVTGKYQIKTDGVSNPIRFQLYNANQSSINYYDNEYNADLTAGTTYYLTARSISSGSAGLYSFVVITPDSASVVRPTPPPLTPELPVIAPLPPTLPAENFPNFETGGAGTDFDDAITAEFDKRITDTVNTAGQVVYYKFVAPVNGRYQIRTDGVSNPTRFQLYNANQTSINYYDNEYLVELTAGTVYYLTARATSSSATGNFAFIIVTPKTFEGNGGVFENAVSIPMDEVISGEFNVPGKVDHFIFAAPVTGRYQIKTDNITNPIRFQLYNANQTSINYYDNEYLVELTAGTIYYLTARGRDSSQNGEYSFTVITPHTTERRGGSFDTPVQPTLNEPVSGKLNVPGKVDYYILRADITGKYTIKNEGNTPLRFQAYKDNQSSINYYDNEYTIELTAGTVYYVTVRATNSNTTGDYVFSITEPSANTFKLGDVDDDGDITIFDALEILKELVGMSSKATNNPAALITSESQQNGTTAIFDALEILKKLVGMGNLIDNN